MNTLSWIWTSFLLAPVAWIFAKDSEVQELKTRVMNIERELVAKQDNADALTIRDKVNRFEGQMDTLLQSINRVEVNLHNQNNSGNGQQIGENKGKING